MHSFKPFSLAALIILLHVHFYTVAQRQLVVVSGDKVIQRFRVGESFRSKWIGDRVEHWGLIQEINEFGLITSQDTIQTKDIRKVLVRGTPFIKKTGITLIKVGLLFFVADQFNSAVIQHNPAVDKSVLTISAAMVGTGLPMLFFKRRWKKIGKNYRLKSIDQDSRLYDPD